MLRCFTQRRKEAKNAAGIFHPEDSLGFRSLVKYMFKAKHTILLQRSQWDVLKYFADVSIDIALEQRLSHWTLTAKGQ